MQAQWTIFYLPAGLNDFLNLPEKEIPDVDMWIDHLKTRHESLAGNVVKTSDDEYAVFSATRKIFFEVQRDSLTILIRSIKPRE